MLSFQHTYVMLPLVALGLLISAAPQSVQRAAVSANRSPRLVAPRWEANEFPWPMFGQNPRRTGQSPFSGPHAVQQNGGNHWTYVASGQASINMQAVLDSTAVYFGGWGLLRRVSGSSPETWDKADGRYYGLSLAGLAGAGVEVFAPLHPGLTPAGYSYPSDPILPRDESWFGAGTSFHISYYNGTIEGTACIDPRDSSHYVGRGDGRMFSIDPHTGNVNWAFTTFDPQRPDHPDGGGQVFGGAVLGPGYRLYFATTGTPWPETLPNNPMHETHAVYCVDTDGQLIWRYPAQQPTLENWMGTAPALSPDGTTLYMGTWAGAVGSAGRVFALDLTQPAGATDAQRLQWSVDLINTSQLFQPKAWARMITVGANGRIYVTGAEANTFLFTSPFLLALNPDGSHAWSSGWTEPAGYPAQQEHFGAGIALLENGTSTDELFMTTSHVRGANGDGGKLYSVDPFTGQVRHVFDPGTLAQPGIGGMTSPTVDATGAVYAGVRGKHPAFAVPAGVKGKMLALDYDALTGFSVLWTFEADGTLDWVPPIIGASGGLYFGSTDLFAPATHAQWFTPIAQPAGFNPVFYGLFD